MIAIIFLCVMKSYLFAMFVQNFTTTSVFVAEILLFIKRWSKIIVANIANTQRNAYLRPPISMPALSVYVIFA